MSRTFLILFSVLSIHVSAQTFQPVQKIQNPALFNEQLDHFSTMVHKAKSEVRILIYGQSISVQDWWKDVKTYFEKSTQLQNSISSIKRSAALVRSG
jgi:hypothetical protein